MNDQIIGDESRAPRWAHHWLLAAGVYNLAWGGAMAVAPIQTLRLLGVKPSSLELWPQFWACIGMIIGVYGIGYLIASRNPYRHWPIVLVGLLGKILGPIGFFISAIQHQLPWSMGLTILTNDLLWWIPFSMILWHAAKASQPQPPIGEVSLDAALSKLCDSHGKTLKSLSDERPTLIVLLRHSGCTFCRQALSDLSKRQGEIEKAKINLAVIGMSPTTEQLRSLGMIYGLTAVAWFADSDRVLYRALDLRRGTFLQLFGPRVWLAGAFAALRGFRIGKLEGDGFQMPGAFLIHHGQIVHAYRHSSASDRPDYTQLSCAVNPMNQRRVA